MTKDSEPNGSKHSPNLVLKKQEVDTQFLFETSLKVNTWGAANVALMIT
jgi:hypothetical protein